MIRKFFSSLLVVILVPIFLIFLIALSAKFSILTPQFYQTAFQKADIYTKIVKDAAPALFNSIGGKNGEGNGRFGLGPLGAEDISKVLEETVKPEWLQTQVEMGLTNFFDFATGKNKDLVIVIPLSEIKSKAVENLSQTFRNKIDSLPTCTAEELKKLQSQDKEGGFSFNCKPSGANSQNLEEMVMSSITGKEGLLSQLPNEYNVDEIILKKPGASEAISRFFTIFGMIFKALIIALGVLIFLLILINHKYILGAFKWLTIPIMISAAIVLTLSLFVHLLSAGLIGGYLTILPGELKSIATFTAIDLIGQLFFKFELYSGIAFGSALILLIIAIILSKKYPYQTKK